MKIKKEKLLKTSMFQLQAMWPILFAPLMFIFIDASRVLVSESC